MYPTHFLVEVLGGGGKYIGLLALAPASSAFAAALSKPGLNGVFGNVGLRRAKAGDLATLGELK